MATGRWPHHGWLCLRSRVMLWRARRRLDIARYWHAHADLDEAARHAHHALRLGSRVGSAMTRPAKIEYAAAMLVIAEIDRDRPDAAASHRRFEQVVEILDAAPSAIDRDRLLARSLIGLGDCHRRAGRYPRAAVALDRARRLVERGHPADPSLLAAVATVEGITAKELGAYDEAARCYAEVAALYDRHSTTMANRATLHHNLAGLAYARQDYQRAEVDARRAVQLRYQARAAPVELAADYAVLGAVLAGQDRHDDAREYLNRALTACRNAQPPRHYEIGVQLHTLAVVDHAVGRLDDAQRGYRQALAIKKRILGPDHPEVAWVCNNLGTLLSAQGAHNEARQCYQWALTIVERAFPAGHPAIAKISRNLDHQPSRRPDPLGYATIDPWTR